MSQMGSNSVIRRCRLNVRFARHRWAIYEYTPLVSTGLSVDRVAHGALELVAGASRCVDLVFARRHGVTGTCLGVGWSDINVSFS
jgi:hypothetical protein